MTTLPLIHTQTQGDIGLVRLSRADKRNALNGQLIDELHAYFSTPPDGVRVVVIHADGDHFCAGLDLIEMLEERSPNQIHEQRRARAWHRAFDMIQFGEIPVISVLKGAVVGGGLELAAATHVRVAEQSSFFQLPEGQRGIFVGGSGAVRIPRIIGAGRMVEMMLTGRKLDVDNALALGLAHYVTPEGGGLAHAMELARQIAGNAPTSNYAVINGLTRIADMSHAEGMFTETMVAAMTGADAEQRIKGFFDQRKQAANSDNHEKDGRA